MGDPTVILFHQMAANTGLNMLVGKANDLSIKVHKGGKLIEQSPTLRSESDKVGKIEQQQRQVLNATGGNYLVSSRQETKTEQKRWRKKNADDCNRVFYCAEVKGQTFNC